MAGRTKTLPIQDDEDEDITIPGLGTDGDAALPGETPITEVAQNAAKLGPSAQAVPLGMPKTVRIILEDNDNIPPTGQPVSVNGKAYLIRSGEPVDVPLAVLEVLDNAVMSVPIKDAQTLKVTGYRNRLRFPYRRVGSKDV